MLLDGKTVLITGAARGIGGATAVTLAAKGGEILVSNVVRELAKGKQFLFSDRGEVALRGFDEAVRLSSVGWRD